MAEFNEIDRLITEIRQESQPSGNTKIRVADALQAIFNYIIANKIDIADVVSNINLNDGSKIPSTVLTYALNQMIVKANYGIEELQQRMDAEQGKGGYLTGYDFGTNDPSQEQLCFYAAQDIWGIKGEWHWEEGKPEFSYYAVNGIKHSILEIFNGTRVTNTFHDEFKGTGGEEWVLTNTTYTQPPVFVWVNRGSSYASLATNSLAGVVLGTDDIPSNEGYITMLVGGQAKVIGLAEIKQIALNAIAKTSKIKAIIAYNADEGFSVDTLLTLSQQAGNTTNKYELYA